MIERWPMTLRYGTGIVLLWLAAAIFAPWLTPADPYSIDLDNVLRPPGGDWLMGTDHVGRDVFTRVVFAARIDIWMGVMGVLAPLVIGMPRAANSSPSAFPIPEAPPVTMATAPSYVLRFPEF